MDARRATYRPPSIGATGTSSPSVPPVKSESKVEATLSSWLPPPRLYLLDPPNSLSGSCFAYVLLHSKLDLLYFQLCSPTVCCFVTERDARLLANWSDQ
ncbi:hypothetical protein SLEP1_g27991 [Rubroshorea leprosula]|uniref:Uncharacterized protein n=1 Tax=Rubroshorea leprosula TaxID=152421 RepID=A0AAV5JS49_9ROSI|nr:hypothetical protein SLEP1_g27991 [Rubroshorea leprosula]